MIGKFSGLESLSADALFKMDKDAAAAEGVRSVDLYPAFRKGSRTGVFLIHGLGGSPKEVEPLFDYLVANGYTVYAPRVSGHGGDFDNMASKTYQDWYNGLRYGYFALKNTCDKICVVGQSNGGLLTCMIALHNHVDSISLLAPAFKVRSFVFPLVRFLRKFLKGVNRHLEASRVSFNHDIFPYESLYQMLLLEKLVQKKLSAINTPVFLGVSEKDFVISSSAATKSVEKMGSNLKSYAFYNNLKLRITHILTEEHLKDDVFPDVLNWVKDTENSFKEEKGEINDK